MPNNISNILVLEGPQDQIDAMLDAVKQGDKRGTLDFDKIIPMPKSLDITSGSMESDALAAYLTAIDPFAPDYGEEKVSPKEYSQKLDMVVRGNSLFSGPRNVKITPELVELGRIYISNLELYGCTTWFYWRVEHWDTKWNAYNNCVDEEINTLGFQTAWSRPQKIIHKLSEMYPDITMEHSWADEDFGNNCGKAIYKGGKEIECYLPEEGSEEAETFAGDVLGRYYNLDEEENELENE